MYKKKKCQICGKYFIPNSGVQKNCGNKKCRLKQKANWENNRYKTCQKYKNRKKKNIKNYRDEARKRAKEWLINYKKNLVCERCGFDNWRCLDFHHKKREEKKGCITKLINDGRAIKSVQQEIRKCEVLCANCHRIEHWEDFKNFRK